MKHEEIEGIKLMKDLNTKWQTIRTKIKVLSNVVSICKLHSISF